MIRILLYEDNLHYQEALQEAFELSDKVYLTKVFDNAAKAVRQIREYQPDIVLMDIEMPGISGLDALKEIEQQLPKTKVMIQTQFEDEHRIFVALCRGAWGYALKSDSFDRLEDAIVEVHQGGGYFSPKIAAKVARLFQNPTFQKEPEYVKLTNREKEVLHHLVHGEKKKYQDIADTMYVSYAAVHSHMKNIYKKLHVTSKSEAIIKAIEGRLV